MRNKIIKYSVFFIALFCVLFVVSITRAADWEYPTCDPSVDPTGCAVSPPLNTSSDSQSKAGSLTIESLFNVNGGMAFDDNTDTLSSPSKTIQIQNIPDLSQNETITGDWDNSANPWQKADMTDYWVDTTGDSMTGTLEITPSGSIRGLDIDSASAGNALNIDKTGTGVGFYLNSTNATGTNYDMYLNQSAGTSDHGGFWIRTRSATYPGLYVYQQDNTYSKNAAILASNMSTVGPSNYQAYLADNTYAGRFRGPVQITDANIGYTSNGISLDIDHYETAQDAVNISVINASATTALLIKHDNASSTGAGIDVDATGAAIKADSSGSDAIKACHNGDNCASIGDTIYAGEFLDEVKIENADSAETYPALEIENSDIDSYALEIDQANSLATANALEVKQSGTGIGVNVDTTSGMGIVGSSNSNIAVKGNTTSGVAGVAGCNAATGDCAYLGHQDYAGYFENNAMSDYDMIGNKILPTRTEYSLFPYVQEIIAGTSSVKFGNKTYTVHEIVFDGTYMWLRADYSTEFFLLKVRDYDGQVIMAYQDPVIYPAMNADGDIIVSGDRLLLNEYSTCSVISHDIDDLTSYNYYLSPGSSNCWDMVYDGSLVWMPEVTNEYLHYFDKSGGGTSTYFDIGAVGCKEPTYAAYDGENIWVTCRGSASVLKVDKDSANTGILTYTLYNLGLTYPEFILFDNTNLWITFDSANPNHLRKYDPTHLSSIDLLQSFAVGDRGINDIEFDGTNIWMIDSYAQELYIIPAYGGGTIRTEGIGGSSSTYAYLESDGTNIWYTYDDPGKGNGFRVIHAANGEFGVSSPDHFYGLKMTETSTGGLYCAFFSMGNWQFAAMGTADYTEYCTE